LFICNLIIYEEENTLKYNKGWSYPSIARCGAFMKKNTLKPLFNQQFMQVVLSIDSMNPYLKVRYKDFITENDIGNGKKMMKTGDRQEILMNIMEKKRTFEINDLIDRSGDIIFNINAGFSKKTVHYNKLNGQTTIVDFIIDDILYSKENMKFNRLTFSCADNNGDYYSLSTEILPQMLKSIENNEILNIENIEKLKTLNEDSNPVLFYYEYKDQEGRNDEY